MIKQLITVVTVVGSLITVPLVKSDKPSGYWESADSYVYYTEESALCVYRNDDLVEFETTDGSVWSAYIEPQSDISVGERYEITFENRESRSDYYESQEYGLESQTRVDNGRLISIE